MYNKSIKKILKASSILLSGSIISSIIGIFVISIIAKELSLKEYGIVVMVQAYILLINQLFNFQSWQALIKYTSNYKDDTKKLISNFQMGITLDIIGSIFALVMSFLLIIPISYILNIDYNLIYQYMFYAIISISSIIGTPTAILRIVDKYKYFNYSLIINWLLKLCLVILINHFYELTIFNIILVFLISETIANVLLIYYAGKQLELLNIKVIDILPTSNILKKFKKNKRFLKFAIRTNLNSAVLGTTRTADELIVGAILSPAAAAIFKIIKIMSTIISKLLNPLYVTFYPEINKYVDNNDLLSIKHIIKKISLVSLFISISIFVGFYLFGEIFIEIFFTKEYLVALPILYLYLIGLLISFTFFFVQPLMLSFELEKIALNVNILCSLLYLLLLYVLTDKYQLWGIAISSIIFWVTVTFLKLLYLKKEIKKRNVTREQNA